MFKLKKKKKILLTYIFISFKTTTQKMLKTKSALTFKEISELVSVCTVDQYWPIPTYLNTILNHHQHLICFYIYF